MSKSRREAHSDLQ